MNKINKTCLSIRLTTAVSLMCIPAWVNAFQPEVSVTRAQERMRDGGAPRTMEQRYPAEVIRVNRMNNPLHEATQQLKDAKSSEDKAAATEAMRTELGKQYDQFLVANERQIEELQDRLDKLREQLVRRKNAKQKMVELELERLINQSEGLVWPSSGGREGIQAFPNSNMNPDSWNSSSEWFRYPQYHDPAAIPATNRPAPPSLPARPRSPR